MRVNCITRFRTASTVALTSFFKRHPWVLWVTTTVHCGTCECPINRSSRHQTNHWNHLMQLWIPDSLPTFMITLWRSPTCTHLLLRRLTDNVQIRRMTPKCIISVCCRLHLRSLGCLSERSIRTSKEQTVNVQTGKALLHPVLRHRRYVTSQLISDQFSPRLSL